MDGSGDSSGDSTVCRGLGFRLQSSFEIERKAYPAARTRAGTPPTQIGRLRAPARRKPSLPRVDPGFQAATWQQDASAQPFRVRAPASRKRGALVDHVWEALGSPHLVIPQHTGPWFPFSVHFRNHAIFHPAPVLQPQNGATQVSRDYRPTSGSVAAERLCTVLPRRTRQQSSQRSSSRSSSRS